MPIRYAFDASGTFVVADDSKRIGEFAFPSSPYAIAAKSNPEKTAKTMLANSWEACPDKLREEHYLLSCQSLEKIKG